MYGILVVEDGNGMYQILGEIASWTEAVEIARCYESAAHPDDPDHSVPPTEYIIWRRNINGAYTTREGFILAANGAAIPSHLANKI